MDNKNVKVLKNLPFVKKGNILPCNRSGIWVERTDLPSAYLPMRFVDMWINDGYLQWV